MKSLLEEILNNLGFFQRLYSYTEVSLYSQVNFHIPRISVLLFHMTTFSPLLYFTYQMKVIYSHILLFSSEQVPAAVRSNVFYQRMIIP